jgi:hypothetical protein
MERALGISYPTVRARVDALVVALGLADGETVSAPGDDEVPVEERPEAVEARRAILQRLAEGKIDAATAAEGLRALEGAD